MIYRDMRPNEYHLLTEFLYEAIFIPEGVEPPDRSIVKLPELAVYYEDFGTGTADHCIVAEDDGRVAGAVWARIMNDYGHIDNETPSLAIAVLPEYRGKGIGTKLMTEMLAHLKTEAFAKASLAVQKANAAVRLYERIGFKVVGENDEEYIMACRLKKICRIRTGGQSGVDRAAMDFAREQSIPLCGWCPKNGWAEDYPNPPGVLTDYPELTETPSEKTEQRTRWNVRDCDAILTIIPKGSSQSPGTTVGLDEGARLAKPMMTAAGPEDVPELMRWIDSLPYGTELCVSGPRASECPEAYEMTKSILDQVAKA